MAEVDTPSTVIVKHYHCDECGEEMTFAGYYVASTPPQYHHRCPNGHAARFPKVYPLVTYIPTEGPTDA